MKILRKIKGLFKNIKHYFIKRRYVLHKVDVKKIKQKDFEKFGRNINCVEKEGDKVVPSKRIIVPVRNKKSGRVVMFAGRLEDLKKTYGDDYEVVETAIKEENKFEIDLDYKEEDEHIDIRNMQSHKIQRIKMVPINKNK